MENNNEHFLKWITVEEFKCFSNFHAEGFKRVNLIGGKNNVGKTALMEAIYINVHSEDIASITTAIFNIKADRESLNILQSFADGNIFNPIRFLEGTNEYKSHSKNYSVYFLVQKEGGIKKYIIAFGGKEFSINANDFSFSFSDLESIHYINAHGFTDKQVNAVFNFVQKLDKEPNLNAKINEFDPNIKSFKFIHGKPQCNFNGTYRELSEFGDGLKSYISIICSLYACQNGYLFIDELDNGIYYEHFDKLWEIILTLSKEMNCQVFATTHSKEMLESFARVAKKLEEQDVSYTLLLKNKEQELKTISFDYEMLEYSMTQEHEVR